MGKLCCAVVYFQGSKKFIWEKRALCRFIILHCESRVQFLKMALKVHCYLLLMNICYLAFANDCWPYICPETESAIPLQGISVSEIQTAVTAGIYLT